MGKRLKATFVVENKAGAGGNLGADVVAKSPADGYTLLFALDTTFTVNPALYRKMPFDPAKDFVTIAVPVTYNQMLVVNEKVKATTVAELVKLAKDQKMTYASGGNGSPSHLTMAAFLAAAGVEMTHIPYKGPGAPASCARWRSPPRSAARPRRPCPRWPSRATRPSRPASPTRCSPPPARPTPSCSCWPRRSRPRCRAPR
jgi:hypothetical protein